MPAPCWACWLLVLPAWQAANWDLVRAEACAEATSLMAPLPGLIETMQEQLAGCTSHCTIPKSSAAALLLYTELVPRLPLLTSYRLQHTACLRGGGLPVGRTGCAAAGAAQQCQLGDQLERAPAAREQSCPLLPPVAAVQQARLAVNGTCC